MNGSFCFFFLKDALCSCYFLKKRTKKPSSARGSLFARLPCHQGSPISTDLRLLWHHYSLVVMFGGFGAGVLAMSGAVKRRAVGELGSLTPTGRLSPRQRQVLDGILSGKPNKVIAHGLGLSTRTVEAHRAAIMSKVGVSSVVELVRLTAGAEPGRDHAELMLKAYPGLVSFWDRNLVGRFANAPAGSPFVQYIDLIVGKTMQDVFGAALFNRSLPYIRGALNGEPQQFRQIVSISGGGLAIHVTHYAPHVDAGGDVDGFFAFTMDISSARQDAIAVDSGAETDGEQAHMILDEDCMILSVNAAFTHVTRYSAEEALGQTPIIIKPTGLEHSAYIAFWKRILAERFWQGTLWYRRRDGYLFRCRQSVRVEPMPGERSRCHALFSAFTIPPAQ